jgi:hypothetical protein
MVRYVLPRRERIVKRLAHLLALPALAVALVDGGTASAAPSMVANGRFESDVFGWTPAANADVQWSPGEDHTGGTSGSAQIRNTSLTPLTTGAYTCVRAAPGIQITASGWVRIPEASQPSGTEAYPFVVFFSDSECGSGSLGSNIGTVVDISNPWQLVTNTTTAPGGANSAWVYFVVLKNTTSAAHAYAFVDDVTVSAPSDADADGCSDGHELQPQPVFGGDRDPNNAWDFFEVTGDARIDLGDTLIVLGSFGVQTTDGGYEPRLDRYIPDSEKPYRTAAAIDGTGIDLTDALASLGSFGNDCTA